MAQRDRRDLEERRPNRDRDSMASQKARGAGSALMNEYFLPRDGIDEEVIEADICRYLGNDALVRLGSYENPQTRQVQQGYFITSYRNLTAAMIADLKADSRQWLAERETQRYSSIGNGGPKGYRASTIHMSRQYHGPTIDSSIIAPQSHSNDSYIAGSNIKSFSDHYDSSRPPSDRSSNYEGGISTSATSISPTFSIRGEGMSYGGYSTNVKSPEAAKRLWLREQPTINSYSTRDPLLQTATQSTIADSITRAGIMTASTIGTIGSIGVGSSYYTSRQTNAQNEAKIAREMEQAERRDCLDERENAMARQEQALRERESTFEARVRALQEYLTDIENRAKRREESIKRKEDELDKWNKKCRDWDIELNKNQAQLMRSENELNERIEKLAEREEEWKRQQQFHCHHLDPELKSSTSSGSSSTSGNEPSKPGLSIAPLEAAKCLMPPLMESGHNQMEFFSSPADEGSDLNQQGVSFSTAIVSPPSAMETKIRSQSIIMDIEDTETFLPIAAPVRSKTFLSELKAQLSAYMKPYFPGQSPIEDIKTNKSPSANLAHLISVKENDQGEFGQVKEEAIAFGNESEHDGSA